MTLRTDRKQLEKVFGSHQEIVQFEELIRGVEDLNSQATQLIADIEAAQASIADIQAELDQILEDLSTFNLNSLSDVSASAPSDGSLLKYVGANEQWEPATSIAAAITDTTENLISSDISLTDVSGSSIATHNNAPVSGDPVKYAPVNDNGTIRAVALYALP